MVIMRLLITFLKRFIQDVTYCDHADQAGYRAARTAGCFGICPAAGWVVTAVTRSCITHQNAATHARREVDSSAGVGSSGGGRATYQSDLVLRPNLSLARAWGTRQFAQQATLADMLDTFNQTTISALRKAFDELPGRCAGTLRHDFRRGDLWLDGDLTGLPASRHAEGSTKGYFAGKKTARAGNWRE
jgi:hypothetical protein